MSSYEYYLINNDIYLETKETLAERIDFAWSVYSESNYSRDQRQRALEFLVYAFDISNVEKINDQLCILMAERQEYQTENPEYIPGKSPTRIPFDPRRDTLQKTSAHGKSDSIEQNKAIARGDILDVNNASKKKDRKESTLFLTPKERAQYRVHLSEGFFKKNGRDFDTSMMISHNKRGFAAFTLNANGELSVFNHDRMLDGIAHSSMNAGYPVVTAGELKIENGVLQAITTHSGHYKPTLFNVHRLLEHLEDNGIDISQAKIITFSAPFLPGVESKEVYYPSTYKDAMYETSATGIYAGMNKIFNENIDSINAKAKDYADGGAFTRMYKIKDKLIGLRLTKERADLAAEFAIELTEFKKGVTADISPSALDVKIAELGDLISKYDQKNRDLAVRYDRSENDGRLAKKMSSFKEKLNSLKEETSEQESILTSSMKNIR